MTYDPSIHMTALEFREMGISIPESVPDYAYTDRGALSPVHDSVCVEALGDLVERRLRVTVGVQFMRPFWIDDDGDGVSRTIYVTYGGDQ